MKTFKVSELICIDLPLSQDLSKRASDFAIEFLNSNETRKALRLLKVIVLKDKIFAYEHLPLISALKRLSPALKIDCIAIHMQSAAEAHQAIFDQLKLASILSLNAVETPAFESHQNKGIKLMPMGIWAKVLRTHRTTLYKHKSKFNHTLEDHLSLCPVDLDHALQSIPNP